MEIFFYFGKVIFASGVMFLYYRLFLKDKTFHHYNRFYLLAATAISLVLPLLKVSYFTVEVNKDIYLLIIELHYFKPNNNSEYDLFPVAFIAFVTGLVAVLFLIKLLVGLAKIQVLKKRFRKENFRGIRFYQTDLNDAPFSFFKNLFWKQSILLHSDLGRRILKHEMVHIEQKHSWDKIFLEITTALFWFNPFFHLIKKEITLIHEYLADFKSVQNSDTKAFAQMLLASRFSRQLLPATSPFFSSNLKKRLIMLKKPKTKYSYARRILALPIFFILAFIYVVNAKNKEIRKSNLEVVHLLSSLKKDTISPSKTFQATVNKNDSAVIRSEIKTKEKALQPLQNEMQAKQEEAQKISEQLQLKSEQMQKLSVTKDFDNPKFKELEKQMGDLSSKLQQLFNSDDFKNKIKTLELNFAEMDKMYAQLDEFYNSDEFKETLRNAEKRAAEAGKLVNSPEFKKKIKDAEKRAADAEKLVNSAEFKKKIKDAEKRAKEMEIKINSPEFQQRIKDATQKAEEAAKRKNVIFLRDAKDVQYFLDGKLVSREEIDKLDPKQIASMNVHQKDGKGEIYIILKK